MGTITDPNACSTTYIAPTLVLGDSDVTETIKLTADDGRGGVHSVEHTITTTAPTNAAPVPVISGVGDGDMGSSGTADGSTSSDADGDTLTYTWSEVTDIGIAFDSPNAPSTSYTLPEVTGDTMATIKLCVNDGNETACTTEDIIIKFVSCDDSEKVQLPNGNDEALSLTENGGFTATAIPGLSLMNSIRDEAAFAPWKSFYGGAIGFFPAWHNDMNSNQPQNIGTNVPASSPDGDGFASFPFPNSAGAGVTWQEKPIHQILDSPILQGEEYRLVANVGGGQNLTLSQPNTSYTTNALRKLVIYGLDYEWDWIAFHNANGGFSDEQLATAIPGIVKLGEYTVNAKDISWETAVIDFVAPSDITTLIFNAEGKAASSGDTVNHILGMDTVRVAAKDKFVCP